MQKIDKRSDLCFLLFSKPTQHIPESGRVHRIVDSDYDDSEKKCTRCGVVKPITDFYVRTEGYFSSQCKDCICERRRVKK